MDGITNIKKRRDTGTAWSEAPTDLLWKMIELLTIADYVRFGAVCVSWRAALAEKRSPPAPQLPWLILPDQAPSSATSAVKLVRFFSLSDNKEYRLPAPKLLCIGSSHGWLILLNRSIGPSSEFEISIFNPISQAHVTLPSIASLPGPNQHRSCTASNRLDKVVLSPNPSMIVAALKFDSSSLAFATQGCTSWSTLDKPGYNHFCDIIFYKEQLCGLTQSGAVVAWDLSDVSHPRLALVVPPPAHTLNHSFRRNPKYLVELSGDLLQVHREVWWKSIGPMTRNVEVLKLDQAYNWERKSLGDHSLFLGHSPSLALSSRDFPLLKRNCVYLANTSFRGDPVGDLRVYHLENRSFEPSPYQCMSFRPPMNHQCMSFRPPMFWFTPHM